MNVQMASPATADPAPPRVANIDAALAAARSLTHAIRARREQVEKDRVISRDTIGSIRNQGLFGLVGAREFGGSEIGIEALVRVTIELASACGSTGWVYGVLAGHSWMLNLFPVEAQREVASVPGSLTATLFRLGGNLVPEGNGYRLSGGTGRFCSGVDHADWVIVGSAVQREGAVPEQLFLLVPRAEIEIVDDWHTVGMRGTGSRSIRIASAFVPAHRTVSIADMVAGKTPGGLFHQKPFYRMSFTDVTPYSIVGAPLGMAREAVACFAEDLKKSMASAAPGSADVACLRLARAATMIDAATTVVLADAAKIDRLADPKAFDELAKRELPRNFSWAVQTCRDAVDELYKLSGGSAIYNQSAMQRIWRDINSAAQHFGFGEDRPMIDYARARLGLKQEAYVIPRPATHS
jgi:alkylation response protein AidB-like acyl-CoA dehydrogenase